MTTCLSKSHAPMMGVPSDPEAQGLSIPNLESKLSQPRLNSLIYQHF